jgi:G3E family GTPase
MIDRSVPFPSDSEPEAGRDVQLDKAGITVLTGFLGSGKTTLINHILTADHGKRIAVIENEFGETAIDGDLIVSSDEEIIEMANGCICCTLSVRNDLTSTLDKLLNRPNPPNHILVETSGLADPVPVAQAFFVDEVADRVAMDAIVTLVDAKHIDRHLDEIRPDSIEGQAVNQLVVADRIVLNKIDLVDAATAARTEERIRSINNTAAVLHSSYAAVALDQIFGIGAFDHTGEAGFGEDFLQVPYPHAHDPEMQSHSFEIAGDLDRGAVEQWIARFVADKARTDAMYRLKGILSVAGEHNTLVIQGVHALIELYRGGSSRGTRRSRLVAIGRGIDPQLMQAELEACRVS